MSKLPSPEQFAQPVPESLSLATSVEDFSRFGRTQTMVAGGPDGYATGIPLDGTPLDIVQAGAEAQQLRTVVGRGDATYGVITCQRPDGSSFTVVRGVGADAKASLLGVGGSSKAVVLGAEAGSNASELRFGLDVRGSQLVITDRSHLNTPYDEQLSIVTANPAEAAPQQVAPNKTAARGLRRALGWLRDRRAKQTVPEQPQPEWALSPEEFADLSARDDAYRAMLGSSDAYITPHSLEKAYEAGKHGSPQAREVLFNGTLDGKPVDTPEVMRSGHDLLSRRMYLAEVLNQDPQTAAELAKVAGLHGSRSRVLGAMLTPELGSAGALYPSRTLHEMRNGFLTGGGDTFTSAPHLSRVAFSALTTRGVGWALDQYAGAGSRSTKTMQDLETEQQYLAASAQSSPGPMGERSSIMAQQLGEAIDFTRQHPDTAFARYMFDDFPVVFGVSAEGALATDDAHASERLLHGTSEMDEFRPLRDSLPLGEALTLVAVPRDKIAEVHAQLQHAGHSNISVVPIESLQAGRTDQAWR